MRIKWIASLVMGSSLAFVGTPVQAQSEFLYVRNFDSGSSTSTNVSAFRINTATGALTSVGNSAISNAFAAKMATDRLGRFIYAPWSDGLNGGLETLAIDPTSGSVSSKAKSNKDWVAYTNPIAADPGGKFVYLGDIRGRCTATDEECGGIYGYSVNGATGAVSLISGSPFDTVTWQSDLVIDLAGRFLYATNRESSRISGFVINPLTGVLTTMTGSPFTTDAPCCGLGSAAIDATGRFLYVSNIVRFTLIVSIRSTAISPRSRDRRSYGARP